MECFFTGQWKKHVFSSTGHLIPCYTMTCKLLNVLMYIKKHSPGTDLEEMRETTQILRIRSSGQNSGVS